MYAVALLRAPVSLHPFAPSNRDLNA